TIRLKLLKIGAVIWRNTRRIRFCLSSACPDKDLFAIVAQRLTAGGQCGLWEQRARCRIAVPDGYRVRLRQPALPGSVVPSRTRSCTRSRRNVVGNRPVAVEMTARLRRPLFRHAASPLLPHKPKGSSVIRYILILIGGANRDRTGDLYNAIVDI